MSPSLAAGIASFTVPASAIAVGAFVARRHGIAASAFAPNVIAALLGGAAVVVALLRPQRPTPLAAVVVALSLLALSLVSPGLDGVHRWVPLGPMRINVSAVVAPWLLWVLATMGGQVRGVVLTAAVSLVHVLQPDAGQATAFGCAAAASFCVSPDTHRNLRAAGIVVALGGVAIAWHRVDPLMPVDHVERIVHLAFALGPLVSIATGFVLALLVAPFAWLAFRGSHTGAVFAVYVVTLLGVTEIGNFPVPVLGAGAGPVLGWYGLFGLVDWQTRPRTP